MLRNNRKPARRAQGTPGLAAAVGMLAALLAAPGHAADTLERIRARGVIVLAHRESSFPLSYVADGRPVGYSLDICHRIAKAIASSLKLKSLRVEYHLVTSATRFEAIERGDADLECGSTTNTAQRRERVAFTIAHFVASSRLLVRTSDRVERLEDLHERAVASTLGTTNLKSLQQEALRKGLTLRVEAARDHAEALQWLESRRVDAFAMDDVLLYGMQANATAPSSLKVVGKPLTIEPYAIAFQRSHTPLKLLIDGEMRRLIHSGELRELYEKWFTHPIPPRGINLQMPMSRLLAESLKYPSDYVPN